MKKLNPAAKGLVKVLEEYPDGHLKEKDIRKCALSLLIAGLETTSMTFYGVINILAHNPDIQTKIHEEIEQITDGKRDVRLPDRQKMMYTRAVIMELLRYTSVVHNGVGHRTTRNTVLKGYRLPENLIVLTCLYNLHHDPEFWDNPESFDPGRFLDDVGDVIPADHPNRKHLMPFGAGIRVCLGESLAQTRLFLWITTMVQRFRVLPAKGNDKSTTETKSYKCAGVLQPHRYEIIFQER
jgi:cytochrome P450